MSTNDRELDPLEGNPGLFITEWRRAKGLKQGDLALKLGMSAAQLCRLEKARHMPTYQTLRRIAAALDIDIQDLTRSPLGEDDKVSSMASVGPSGAERIFERIYREGVHPKSVQKMLFRPRPVRLRRLDAVSESNEDEDSLSMEDLAPVGRSSTAPKHEWHPFPTAVLEASERFLGGEWQAMAGVKVLEYRLAEKKADVPSRLSLPLHFPAEVAGEDPDALARAVRTAGGIGVAALPDVVTFLEDKGVRVIETTLPQGENSLILWDGGDRNAWLFLDRAATDERQQFRAAMELGNLLQFVANGYERVPDTPLTRRFSKDFASAFLMPDAALRELSYQLGRTRDNWTLDLIYHVKQRFGVSAEAFTYRLALLNLIRQGLKTEFIKEIKSWYDQNGHTEPHPSKRKASRRSRYDNLLGLIGQ